MGDDDLDLGIQAKKQSSILWILLLINAVMFFVEFSAGLIAQSTGLLGDSLDMFADAAVYGIALYAVRRSQLTKATAALFSGVFQILLALLVILEVARKFVFGSDPLFGAMIAIGALALAANIASLLIIRGQRAGEVHMRASWIFSQNDVIVNLGVIVGGVLVGLLGSRFPDLIIGFVVALFVAQGGLRIIKDAAEERRKALGVGA